MEESAFRFTKQRISWTFQEPPRWKSQKSSAGKCHLLYFVEVSLSFLSLFFEIPCFLSCMDFLVFLSVFPFYSRDSRGSVGIKILVFLCFLAFSQKKKHKERKDREIMRWSFLFPFVFFVFLSLSLSCMKAKLAFQWKNGDFYSEPVCADPAWNFPNLTPLHIVEDLPACCHKQGLCEEWWQVQAIV